jgi:hypothetical protein
LPSASPKARILPSGLNATLSGVGLNRDGSFRVAMSVPVAVFHRYTAFPAAAAMAVVMIGALAKDQP